LKVVVKPIEMISYTNREGVPRPVKFRVESEDKTFLTIKVDKVIQTELEKYAGNRMYKFRCQSIISGTEKIYEIKYEIDTCKWILYKI